MPTTQTVTIGAKPTKEKTNQSVEAEAINQPSPVQTQPKSTNGSNTDQRRQTKHNQQETPKDLSVPPNPSKQLIAQAGHSIFPGPAF